MASDEEFMFYEATQSGAALAGCGRPDIVTHHGRSHSDEAESSQKPYSGGEGRDEYSDGRDFCGGYPVSLTGEERLHGKGLELMHDGKSLEVINGRVLGIQSQALMGGMNDGGQMRRTDRSEPGTSKSIGSQGKRKDIDDVSDGGTYYKKGKINGGDGYKKDREEWSDGAISCLLNTYTEKYLQLNRGNLRGSDWEEVAALVSDRADGRKSGKTVDQCKNKVDSLKKRYKTEKSRGSANGVAISYWPWFKKVDQIVGTGPKLTVMSDEDEREKTGIMVCSPSMKPTIRLPTLVPVTLGCVNAPKKSASSLRWRRVLLKVSGEALAGDHSQNIDPKITVSIAREVASVARLGVEVAIVVGGGNFFHGSSWVNSGGLDRASADHIGMMATVMNSIFLRSSLENMGIPTRVQTAFKIPEVAEPYIRQKATRHLEKGRVVIFGAGTGNPYFTTDTAAAIRAAEINAEVVLKATVVDGVYSSDPKINPDAVLLEHLSYGDVAAKGITVMDITAVSLCQENEIPVVIFNLNEPGNISRAISGERIGTLIDQTGGVFPGQG